MRRRKQEEEPVEEPDPSAWLITGTLAEFLMMHTNEIKYMCMFGYTFLHGTKLFAKLSDADALSYKFVSMIFACTGGGTLVPIFINSIPVVLANDSYPIAIAVSFLLHEYVPVLREVVDLSPLLKALLIVLYETFRASVVVKLTYAAGSAIAPSEFSFPVFGPIFCGGIGGCGGAFFPLNKGLDPLKQGLLHNMVTALLAAAGFHLFLNTSWSDGVKDAKAKAHVCVAFFFVLYGLYKGIDWKSMIAETKEKKTKKENKTRAKKVQ